MHILAHQVALASWALGIHQHLTELSSTPASTALSQARLTLVLNSRTQIYRYESLVAGSYRTLVLGLVLFCVLITFIHSFMSYSLLPPAKKKATRLNSALEDTYAGRATTGKTHSASDPQVVTVNVLIALEG